MDKPLGLILAGGLARRMGGQPKADVILGGERLLDRCAARLSPQVDDILVNANTPVETSYPVISDSLPSYLGPLAGVLSGLQAAAERGASHIVSVAVDTPFFPCDLVPQLQLAALDSTDGFAVAATPDGVQGAFALWPVTLAPTLQTWLTGGNRKVRDFTSHHGAAIALFPATTPNAFFNINTPDDLTEAARWT
ncbi:molybdenum cofactor guanylyltransferase MobA [Pseudooctadecabacter jejudonensis]|uniref:Molybdenum cofactor guanylyltransferase n=1 Tax=Pseudooctadecabacter jejudonensis TaxID=1391910 RepID=A0A1Y5T0Z0_9RHOB|nr:molybdenum cofactor guanylyltransferase MobA [Pseudooctadecabacter jejudonensis]SLN53434.1 Molybdenum cofactor guanylyltransferase [Pseudooctadecabacter jejudonensis]